MSEEDIADTIAAFAAATSEAERAGFDVIELHGAHGYLTDQSFWGATNHRSDRFGGETLRLRTLFAVELLRAVRGTVSADFPVIVRVSQWKMQDYQARLGETPGALGEWLGSLVIAGSDMLHCSQRRFWGPEFPEIDGAAGLNLGGGQRRSLGPRRSPLAQLAWVTWRGQPHWPDWPGGWSMASSISRRLGGHS
jgi:2,4-dienoyl-CoA reductase-like NADH-dependent reductase (Old Yellow Enzyme family)